jgi:hypothetical protein
MLKGIEEYLVQISNRFAALEILSDDVDISRAWETIRENIVMCRGLRVTKIMGSGSVDRIY